MNKRIIQTNIVFVFILVFCVAGLAQAQKKPKLTNKAKNTREYLFNQGKDLLAAGKYKKALAVFEKTNAKYRNEPELLNAMGFTQMKMEKYDLAIKNFQKALKLKPDYHKSRVNLGHAYIKASFKELETLQAYVGESEDADNAISELTTILKDAAADLYFPNW